LISEYNRGTGCGKTARPGLCGGRPVTGVPTAENLKKERLGAGGENGVQQNLFLEQQLAKLGRHSKSNVEIRAVGKQPVYIGCLLVNA